MGCAMAVFGALLPRFVLLASWSNASTYWNSLFGSQVWLAFGFLFFPWTTLLYGIAAPNGLTIVNWIFIGCALAVDLGTWGIGGFASRKQTSNFRDLQ